MSNDHGISASISKLLLAAVFSLAAAGIALAAQESTIFTYDGQDFIRAQTTLTTEDGKPAVNTKLDRNSPAYKELIKKHSYTGEAILFGKRCDASYAPLVNASGHLTGALFVALCNK
ncbi:MAG: Cache 3/Cache 2 fusion domain-containing protein [Betaproteobacteria bacterium]|nr:Cache 3/Cache 2 fusion domain-containing protein [Betaproteobacteria bacterium]